MSLTKPTTSLFGRGLGKTENTASYFDESKTLTDLEADVSNPFVHIYESMSLYKNAKPLEGIEAFDKKLLEIEVNSTRSILHYLSILSSEIDHGNLIVSEIRDELESFRRDLANSGKNRSTTSPFLSRFMSNIKKRSLDINESISSLEKNLQIHAPLENPMSVVQVIKEQHDAILRCGARLSDIRDKSEEIMQRLSESLKKQGVNSDVLKSIRMSEDRNSIVSQVEHSYEQYKEERKRNLEKRDKTTNFVTICARPTTGKFGLGSKLGGLSSTSSTLNKGTTTTNSTSLLKK